MTPVFLGVDPGLAGGIVLLDHESQVLEAWRMPRLGGSSGKFDGAQACEWLRVPTEQDVLSGIDMQRPGFALIEEQQIRRGESGRSALTIGTNWGILKGALLCRGWRHDTITPARWRKALGLPARKEPAQRKADSIALCRSLLPDLDLTPGRVQKPLDGLAEAGLLAVLARRTYLGELAA